MIDYEKLSKELDDFLETSEGKQSIIDFSKKLKKQEVLKNRWDSKFVKYLRGKTDEELHLLFINFEKHESKRRNILYSQHIDGQTSLYQPLMTAFEILGEEADKDAYGDFSSAIYDWRNYRIELYCGQGCFNTIKRL